MNRVAIRKGQIWRMVDNPMYRVLISGTKGGKFLAKVLTAKPDVYNGSHSLARNTLWSRYELV